LCREWACQLLPSEELSPHVAKSHSFLASHPDHDATNNRQTHAGDDGKWDYSPQHTWFLAMHERFFSS
jgi:hypothetical protein